MPLHHRPAAVVFDDRVMPHPGTNGYVSTWGDWFSGVRPLPHCG